MDKKLYLCTEKNFIIMATKNVNNQEPNSLGATTDQLDFINQHASCSHTCSQEANEDLDMVNGTAPDYCSHCGRPLTHNDKVEFDGKCEACVAGGEK